MTGLGWKAADLKEDAEGVNLLAHMLNGLAPPVPADDVEDEAAAENMEKGPSSP